jgi:MFS family permease
MPATAPPLAEPAGHVDPAPGASCRGAILAVAIAAASTGVVIPALRLLVEQAGHGPAAGGLFVASHVLGGVVGAALGGRALQLAGSARRLAAAALVGSVIATLAIAAIDALPARLALRFVDGALHLSAITALVAAGTAGTAEARARRAIALGLAIVLGVAAGLGLGAGMGRLHPEAALVAAAALSAIAAAVVITRGPAGDPAPAPRAARGARAALAPTLLAFGERFVFGALAVVTPFVASPARVGVVLGVFMTASVVALPLGRRLGRVWGARRLALVSALAFGATLAAAGAVDVLARLALALPWAIASGTAAGALYAAALLLAARSSSLADRARDLGAVHAAGSAGHALGALTAGALASALPGMLAVAIPGVAAVAAIACAVIATVPAATEEADAAGATSGGGAQPLLAAAARE